MNERQKTIGNYLADQNARQYLNMTAFNRQSMVLVMQELHRIKKYHIETLFLGCSIADRFLVKLAERRIIAPNLV